VDKIEDNIARWQAASEPALEAFRITVTAGEQVVRLGDTAFGTLPTSLAV